MIALWNNWLTDDVQTMTTGIRGSQNLWPNSSGELKWRNGCNYHLNQPFTVVWLYHLLDLSAWCVALCPSQQLWSCKNGQFTLPHFFMDKLDKVINQYFVHILSLVNDNNLSWFSWRKETDHGNQSMINNLHSSMEPVRARTQGTRFCSQQASAARHFTDCASRPGTIHLILLL